MHTIKALIVAQLYTLTVWNGYITVYVRDVNFDVFVGDLLSTKFKSLKFYKTAIIHLKHKVC